MLLFLLAIFCIVILVYAVKELLKKPTTYVVTLVSKKTEIYKDQMISYMTFTSNQVKFPNDIKCYTIGQNKFIENREYLLKIKDVVLEPKYIYMKQSDRIEDINEEIENKKDVKKYSTTKFFVLLTIITLVLNYMINIGLGIEIPIFITIIFIALIGFAFILKKTVDLIYNIIYPQNNK